MRNHHLSNLLSLFCKLLLFLAVAVTGALIALFLILETTLLGGRFINNDQLPGSEASLEWQTDLSNISAIADRLAPTVVSISNIVLSSDYFGSREVVRGSGSGVIFSAAGYIITNNHVVAGADKLYISLADGRQSEAVLIGADQRSDLALLRLDLPELPVAPLGDSDLVQVGELALAIGNPGGEQFARSLTMGIISGLDRLVQTAEGSQFRLIQTDAAINPGNSGGPLVNVSGEVIGINSIKISEDNFEGMGFAIPINTVMRVIDDLMQHGTVIRPALQVMIWGELSPELAAYNNFIVDHGVIVVPQSGGVAEAAGLRRYDVIIALDGEKVTGTVHLQELIFLKMVGESITVSVMRGSELLEFEVTLAQLAH